MKNGRSHHRPSRNRNHTPTVICLPPPRPPITQPRMEPDATPAIPLPVGDEALATHHQPGEAAAQSRQLRRQARRAEMKASRRGPPLPGQVSAIPATAAPKAEMSPVGENVEPLPRNRSLATQPRGLARIGQWIGRLIRRSAPTRATPGDVVTQLRAMRSEMTQMQQTLDRLLGGAAA